MFFLASTDLIDPKEAPKSVKSLGIVFLILVLGHIGSQGAVQSKVLNRKKIQQTSDMISMEDTYVEKHTKRNFSYSTRDF